MSKEAILASLKLVVNTDNQIEIERSFVNLEQFEPLLEQMLPDDQDVAPYMESIQYIMDYMNEVFNAAGKRFE